MDVHKICFSCLVAFFIKKTVFGFANPPQYLGWKEGKFEIANFILAFLDSSQETAVRFTNRRPPFPLGVEKGKSIKIFANLSLSMEILNSRKMFSS